MTSDVVTPPCSARAAICSLRSGSRRTDSTVERPPCPSAAAGARTGGRPPRRGVSPVCRATIPPREVRTARSTAGVQATWRYRRRASRMISLVVVSSALARASTAARSSGSRRTGTTSAGPDPMGGRPPRGRSEHERSHGCVFVAQVSDRQRVSDRVRHVVCVDAVLARRSMELFTPQSYCRTPRVAPTGPAARRAAQAPSAPPIEERHVS